MDDCKVVGVADAAKRLKLSKSRVMDFIKDDRLPHQMVGKTYVILERDLIAFGKIPRKDGRPPSK